MCTFNWQHRLTAVAAYQKASSHRWVGYIPVPPFWPAPSTPTDSHCLSWQVQNSLSLVWTHPYSNTGSEAEIYDYLPSSTTALTLALNPILSHPSKTVTNLGVRVKAVPNCLCSFHIGKVRRCTCSLPLQYLAQEPFQNQQGHWAVEKCCDHLHKSLLAHKHMSLWAALPSCSKWMELNGWIHRALNHVKGIINEWTKQHRSF